MLLISFINFHGHVFFFVCVVVRVLVSLYDVSIFFTPHYETSTTKTFRPVTLNLKYVNVTNLKYVKDTHTVHIFLFVHEKFIFSKDGTVCFLLLFLGLLTY
jgi:hypothetical protein